MLVDAAKSVKPFTEQKLSMDGSYGFSHAVQNCTQCAYVSFPNAGDTRVCFLPFSEQETRIFEDVRAQRYADSN